MNEQDEQFNCNSSNASVTSSNSCGGVNTTSTTNFTCNLQQSLTEVKQSETFSIDTKYFNEDASINTPPQLISPLSAFMLADICKQSGVPNGVINIVMSGKSQ